ncbi:MAG: ATP-grasp domain-containing protein [Sedimenticola sp.]
MQQLDIAVTGINASDNPAPGAGVARSLKESSGMECRIAGLAYDALEPGIYMEELFDQAFIIPYPTAGCEELLERLTYVRDRFGMDVVIPTLDSELPFYMLNSDELQRLGIHSLLPTPEQYRLRAKVHLTEVGELVGVETPQQQLVSSPEAVIGAVREIGLPVMIKGSLYQAYIAHTLEEAVGLFHKVAAKWGYPVIVQERVKGEELNVIAVGDGSGNTLGLVAVRKMSVTELGKIWTGVTIRHPALEEATRRFIDRSRWRGALEMECRVEGERIHLIEINPRFPAWVYFATGVGINLPAMLVRQALGLPVTEEPDYTAGKLFVRYVQERISDMTSFQNMVIRGET